MLLGCGRTHCTLMHVHTKFHEPSLCIACITSDDSQHTMSRRHRRQGATFMPMSPTSTVEARRVIPRVLREILSRRDYSAVGSAKI